MKTLSDKWVIARSLEILGGTHVSPEAVKRGLREMSMFRCNNCGELKDADWECPEEDPSNPCELICEHCWTEKYICPECGEYPCECDPYEPTEYDEWQSYDQDC